MNNFLNCVMDNGEQMLVCGAEVHRVEDSVERMCYALGVKRIDVFIITSSMVVTVCDRKLRRNLLCRKSRLKKG